MTVEASGFTPNELVGIFTATDTNIDTIAATTADVNGAVSTEVTLSNDLCGDVDLIAWAPGSGTGVRQDITITACALPDPPAVDQLPTTGDNNNLIMWSLLFATLGALVVLRLRTTT